MVLVAHATATQVITVYEPLADTRRKDQDAATLSGLFSGSTVNEAGFSIPMVLRSPILRELTYMLFEMTLT